VVEKNNTAQYLIYGAQERALMGTESAVTHIKGFESGHSVEKMVNFNQNKMINMQYMNSIALQQQQQHSLLSQASWGRLEMKPKRDEKMNSIALQ
jgi:hypothetical protein